MFWEKFRRTNEWANEKLQKANYVSNQKKNKVEIRFRDKTKKPVARIERTHNKK